MAASETLIVLLRGVNVGGKNRLPMSDLVAICEGAGCTNVRTYIQSGNVILSAPKRRKNTLAAELAEGIRQSAGLTVPVVVRTAEELAQAVTGNPFLANDVETKELHVMFLAEVPKAEAVAKLDVKRSEPDEFRVVGRDIFLRLPNGVARSKLTNDYFDRTLATTSTARNWNTVLKLLELARDSSQAA